jgi:hypothetical protein
VTPEIMIEFITAVTVNTIKDVNGHPDHIHEPSQNFKPVADKTLIQDMLRAGDESTKEKIRGLQSSSVTIQMDAGTILYHHFFNYVVSHPGLMPFFFHTEFHSTSARVDYSTSTGIVVEQLLEKRIVVAGIVADN